MIDEEIAHAKQGEESYIGIKINSLTDKAIITKLVETSQAGVKIEMIVRGICCLIPGIEGYTENIKVVSIVGRFLEHSRIYRFGTKERLDWMFETMMKDNEKGKCLNASGKYVDRESNGTKLNSQELFYAMAYSNAEKAQTKA